MHPVLPTVSPRGFLRVTQVAPVLVALNIISGAAVRLSDSGLGCPDWPTCSHRHLTPPLSLHPAIEFANRLVVVGVTLVVALAALAALVRRPRRSDLTGLSVGLIGGILAEIVIGGLVVYSKLNPYVVMVHFMVGIGLLTVAVILALKAGRAAGPGTLMVAAPVRTLAAWMFAVLSWPSPPGRPPPGPAPTPGGRGPSGSPCPWPTWPGPTPRSSSSSGPLTLVLLYFLDRTRAPEKVALRGRILLAVMVGQGLIGYTQYFTHLPPLLVGSTSSGPPSSGRPSSGSTTASTTTPRPGPAPAGHPAPVGLARRRSRPTPAPGRRPSRGRAGDRLRRTPGRDRPRAGPHRGWTGPPTTPSSGPTGPGWSSSGTTPST